MKKLLFAVVLGLIVVAALATTALADNGPHGGFTANTDACASCHRAHTAKSADGFLLVQGDIYLLCTSCHNGAGAYTNVVDGVYMAAVTDPTKDPGPAYGAQGDAGIGLFGGGFEQAAMTTTRLSLVNGYDATIGNPLPAPITSHHSVDAGVVGTVWGAGPVSAVAGTQPSTYALECTSCHDPHGKAGRTGAAFDVPTASYRLLRFDPHGSAGFDGTAAYWTPAYVQAKGATDGGVHVADVATYWYTINADATVDPSVQAYRARWDGTAGRFTPWWSYVNFRGDYAGRTYVYMRPSFQISTAIVNGTSAISCAPAANTAALDSTCAYPGNPAAGSVWNNTVPMGKLGYWCATCHDRYLASGAGRTTPSGDADYMYRHSTTSVSCVNCHTAHGATSTMDTPLVQNATLNNNQSTALNGMTGWENMLKLDNRGLCADCHGYDVNWSSSPNVIPVP